MMHGAKLDHYQDVQSSISEYIGKKNLRAIAPTISELPHESVVYYMNDIDESELNPAML